MNIGEQFLHCFIPLFVAINALGILPLFLGMTDEMDADEKDKLITQASVTAFAISLAFLFVGKLIFVFLGITKDDFRIAGGIILLLLSVSDLVFSSGEKRRVPSETVGIVPIGVPLIIGPAALTTILIVVDSYGYWLSFLSLIINLAFVWIVFRKADRIVRFVGRGGTKAFAKVAELFLAAIAIRMIRSGLVSFIGHAQISDTLHSMLKWVEGMLC